MRIPPLFFFSFLPGFTKDRNASVLRPSIRVLYDPSAGTCHATCVRTCTERTLCAGSIDMHMHGHDGGRYTNTAHQFIGVSSPPFSLLRPLDRPGLRASDSLPSTKRDHQDKASSACTLGGPGLRMEQWIPGRSDTIVVVTLVRRLVVCWPAQS
jgi:hypothetical protein